MKIGTALYNYRTSRHLSQRKLSDGLESKISQGSLALYENGKRTPSLENLQLLADFYDVPVAMFFVSDDVSDVAYASAIAEQMKQNSDFRELFELAVRIPPEDLKMILSLMRNMAAKVQDDE